MEEIIQTLQNDARDREVKDLMAEDEAGEDSKPGMLRHDSKSYPKSDETDLNINPVRTDAKASGNCRNEE